MLQVRNLIGYPNSIQFLQVRALKARMQSMQRSEECLQLEEAKVVRVLPVGMGDRVR